MCQPVSFRTPGTHTQKPSSHLNTHGKWHLHTSHLRQIRRCLNHHTQIPSHPIYLTMVVVFSKLLSRNDLSVLLLPLPFLAK